VVLVIDTAGDGKADRTLTFDTGFHWLGTDNDQTTGDRVFMPFLGAHFGWNHPWCAHWGTEAHPPNVPVSGPLFEGSGTAVVFGDSPQFPSTHRGVFFINDWLRKTTFVWRPHWDGAGCFNCHRLGEHGNGFVPDRAALGERATARHIVQSMLEPNAVITEGFRLQTVETADAEYSGILLEESGLSLTLGLATGQRQVLPKSRITSRTTAATSAMAAYDTVPTPQYAADLGAYLLAQKADEAVTTQASAATTPSAPGVARRSGAAAPGLSLTVWPEGDGFRFTESSDRLVIAHSGQPVAEFVFRDERILRPYFANVHAPGGVKATRNYPPVAGVDAIDHDTMHPGLWLAFGDISGTDFWRNKGRIEHVRFSEPATVQDGRLTFDTECRLRAPDGRTLCSLTNRFTLTAPTNAWILVWDATFHSDDNDFTLGDQEEMGFGARVATAITEKNGGVITSSTGLKTAKATWGQPAEWCAYLGTVDGRSVGVTLMADPRNFRPSWWHHRDYGVFVANPFGRDAMKQGAKSAVTVKRGEDFRLRFGAAVHAGSGFDPAAAVREGLHRSRWITERVGMGNRGYSNLLPFRRRKSRQV